MLTSPRMLGLLRAGRLGFITTNEMHHFQFQQISHAWQAVYYSHALLSHWGSPTRLLLTDMDEFLVVPPAIGSLQVGGSACCLQ